MFIDVLQQDDRIVVEQLDGLSGLSYVGGDLHVHDNVGLLNINGMSNLTAVGSDLLIADNDLLVDLSGLSSLASVGHDLDITNNQALCESYANAVVAPIAVTGYVNIYGNNGTCP